MKSKRIVTLALALVLLFLLALPSYAKQDISLQFLDDDSFIYDGNLYDRYYSFDRLDRYLPEVLHYMDTEIVDKDGNVYSQRVYTNADRDIFLFPKDGVDMGSGPIPAVYLQSSVYSEYVGEKSMRESRYWDQDSSYRILSPGGTWASYPYSEIRYGKTDALAIEVFAEGLKDYARYDICAYYDDGEFARCIGAIYENNSRYLYVPYGNLPKTYFDSDGNLNYDGNFKVRAYRVYSTSAAPLEAAISSMTPRQVSLKDVTPSLVEIYSTEIFLIVVYSLFSFILPLVPLILGLVFAASKKTDAFKRWILLAILSLVWIVLAAVILIVILL